MERLLRSYEVLRRLPVVFLTALEVLRPRYGLRPRMEALEWAFGQPTSDSTWFPQHEVHEPRLDQVASISRSKGNNSDTGGTQMPNHPQNRSNK